jgi:UDP-N-acetylmuramoyl-L-alanyl-D-glutamate--2,6-diaminopimelate ligase
MFRKFVKKLIPHGLFEAVEPYGHLLESIIANIRYGFPARGLNIIGITGTNGKTTTATMVYTMLNDAGIKTGLMTTIGYGTPGQWTDNKVHMTTTSAAMSMRRIKELRARGIDWLVFEVTSHALAQNRAWGVPYSIAVMTNVTHEHLDYHKTFDRYVEAKVRLFEQTNANKAGLRVGIVNAEDPSAEKFAAAITHPIRYGITTGDFIAPKVTATPTGNQMTIKGTFAGKTGEFEVKTKLAGQFNVSNALAAAAVGEVVGLTTEQVKHGLEALDAVEGRMNIIDEGQDFSVIVDFAHTPDSFEQILGQMAGSKTGRLITVFGSAGRRDESKRAIQGQIAGKYADVVVVTEEDDRDIDGQLILNQIAEGADSEGKVRGKDLYLVHDRTEAIAFAVNQARAGDTVLLLGKGHEKTIEGPTGERPWDETAAARKAIISRLKK